MLGFNGGLVGKERLATSAALGASGLWLPNEQNVAKRANKWPAGPNELPGIGGAFGGGFFAGLISHTANGVATHALVVAPRATGATGTGYTLTTMQQWSTTGIIPAGTSTFNGRANTDIFIGQGISNYPAAQFCTTLSIGGYTDWYLPARHELDIAYFNLKPTADGNYTSANTGLPEGVNPYSVPARPSEWSSGNPPRTSVAAFQSGGTEAFTDQFHWTSNQRGDNQLVSTIDFRGGYASTGNAYFSNLSVRAFRRVPV
jgi:hypothetical protein